MSATDEQVARLVDDTSIAYSYDRYANWSSLVRMLLRRGFTEVETAAILRSKWTRWAADESTARYGKATSKDLERFIDRQKNLAAEVAALVAGTV